MKKFDALYYPFSRCMDVAQIKQLLLQFDSVTFVDPVHDDSWRAQLFENMESKNTAYRAYRDLADSVPWLRENGIFNVVDPDTLKSRDSDLTVNATLGDLADGSWVAAANPQQYGLPTLAVDGTPSWDIFPAKMPSKILESITSAASLSKHLLVEDDYDCAWSVSFAAGSSISMNVHLAAAEELGLSPVTDSRLHHALMLMKLARSIGSQPTFQNIDLFSKQVAQHTITRLMGQVLPSSVLEMISLEEIIQFRKDTAPAKAAFMEEVLQAVQSHGVPTSLQDYLAFQQKFETTINRNATLYAGEVADIRNRVWPKVLDGLTGIPAGVSLAGIAASYISGSALVLLASAAAFSVQPLRTLLDFRADLIKAQSSPNSALAYLSEVQQLNRSL